MIVFSVEKLVVADLRHFGTTACFSGTWICWLTHLSANPRIHSEPDTLLSSAQSSDASGGPVLVHHQE